MTTSLRLTCTPATERRRRVTWADVIAVDHAMDVISAELGMWPIAGLFLRRLARRRARLVRVLVRRAEGR